MQLFLSSEGFGNHLEYLKEIVGDDKRVLYVENAKDYYEPEARFQHLAEKKLEFENAGFEFYELDLRNYFKSPATLEPILGAAHFVWVGGGNTFVLRRAMKYSGFDTLIANKLRAGTMVYGGSSAGSIVMCRTLRGTENGDDPYVVPDGYTAEIVWDGLGLIKPQLIPHVGSDRFKDEAQAMIDYMEGEGYSYVPLSDGQVYAVEGGSEELLK